MSAWVSDNRNCLGECQLELEKLRANHGIRMVLPLESRPDMTEPVSGSVTVEVRLQYFAVGKLYDDVVIVMLEIRIC